MADTEMLGVVPEEAGGVSLAAGVNTASIYPASLIAKKKKMLNAIFVSCLFSFFSKSKNSFRIPLSGNRYQCIS